MLRILSLLLWLSGAVAAAVAAAVGAQAGGSPPLAPDVLRLLQDDPDALLRLCEDVIAGYGGPAGLEADGIEAAIGLQRAEARAIWLHRMQAMDIDGDGAVTGDELQWALQSVSAVTRARNARAHAAADTDRDGDVSADELRAGAEAAGLRRLDAGEARVLRGLMAFDADGNGLVTLAEFRTGAAVLGIDDDA